MFWILRRVFGFWEVFFLLGSVFGFWEVFFLLGSVFGFWEVFWILGSVLESGKCFVLMSHRRQAILNHEWENSRATNLARNVLILTFFRGSKSINSRYRFCTIWLVGLEEEIIDKDFKQSYWLALQFWVQPTGFLPWECHRHPTEWRILICFSWQKKSKQN